MFNMKIEKQLNIHDRTLISGKPSFDVIPETVLVDGNRFKVIGVSQGIKLPYMSLEIEKTNMNLENRNVTM